MRWWWPVSPWGWWRDRRDLRFYSERRALERPVEQLAAEAALFLQDPEPRVIYWPRVIEVPARPPADC